MADNEQGQVFQSLEGAYGVVFMLFKLVSFPGLLSIILSTTCIGLNTVVPINFRVKSGSPWDRLW